MENINNTDNTNNTDNINEQTLLLKKKNKNLKRNYLRFKKKYIDELNKNKELNNKLLSIEKKLEWVDDWENLGNI